MILRKFRDDWTPPILRRAARVLRRRRDDRVYFEGDFGSWSQAMSHCSGYQHDQILQKVLSATLRVIRGEFAYERDSINFTQPEYSWPILGALMWVAHSKGGAVRVLDFGGSLGSTFFQHLGFLRAIPQLRWRVVEQPNFVDAGRAHLQSDSLSFHEDLSEACSDGNPDFLLASSVLQYIAEPISMLNRLIDLQPHLFMLDRTCFDRRANRAVLKIQHVPASIYKASYPCWFLDELEVDSVIKSRGYELVAEFPALDRLDERAEWKGKLFRRVGA